MFRLPEQRLFRQIIFLQILPVRTNKPVLFVRTIDWLNYTKATTVKIPDSHENQKVLNQEENI